MELAQLSHWEKMTFKNTIKKRLADTLVGIGVDRLGRWINRHKLLTVMYHGITRQNYDPPVWTQLPADVFETQIKFLNKHYKLVSLKQVVAAINSETVLPERALLITFDDGLRNNATVAWPVLQKYEIPATIFLTVDFIGTDKFFWVDELYIYLVEAEKNRVDLHLGRFNKAERLLNSGDIWGAYLNIVEALKRISDADRGNFLQALQQQVTFDRKIYFEDFGLLGWDQVMAMANGGLISFGAHTATHQILTQMDSTQVENELIEPRNKLTKVLERNVTEFCYPNGRFGVDFTADHSALLQQIGYSCAFSTDRKFFRPTVEDPFSIGRIPAGNDFTSYPNRFRLSTAGF